MQYFPAALQGLTDHFARLPGIGGKTAQRLAFHVLSLPEGEAQAFAEAILDAKRAVHTCPVCQNLTDREICPICDDPSRDKGVICVVADPRDVIAMERSREFNGVYHVLHVVVMLGSDVVCHANARTDRKTEEQRDDQIGECAARADCRESRLALLSVDYRAGTDLHIGIVL